MAAQGRYRTAPNPMVGAVVVRGEKEVVGRGYHARVGGDHAEIVALEEAASRARGATLWVTLEPCCHQGRTPPCVERVLDSGIARVVACHEDPNPAVSGRGFEFLRNAGVDVVVGELARQALALNLKYLVPRLWRRPQVTLKWAMSLDGKIATASGESQWISSSEGRDWALDLREEHDAILVGSGTVLADDPSLNRRRGKAAGKILRVVLDRRLRLPPSARLLDVDGPLLVYTESADKDRVQGLCRDGVEIVQNQPTLPATVLEDLWQRGVQSVLVEGGAEILGTFVAQDLFDQVEICCAPKLIGGVDAASPLSGKGASVLAAAPRLEDLEGKRVGPDFILSGYREGRLAEIGRRIKQGERTADD